MYSLGSADIFVAIWSSLPSRSWDEAASEEVAYSEVETVFGAVEVLVVHFPATASTYLVVFDLHPEGKQQVDSGCRCLMERHMFGSDSVEVAARSMMLGCEPGPLAWSLHIQRQHGHIVAEEVG